MFSNVVDFVISKHRMKTVASPKDKGLIWSYSAEPIIDEMELIIKPGIKKLNFKIYFNVLKDIYIFLNMGIEEGRY